MILVTVTVEIVTVEAVTVTVVLTVVVAFVKSLLVMAVDVTVLGLTVVMMFVKFLLAMVVIVTVAALTVVVETEEVVMGDAIWRICVALHQIWTAVKTITEVKQRVIPEQKEHMLYQISPSKRFN